MSSPEHSPGQASRRPPPPGPGAFDRLAGRWTALEDPRTRPGAETAARIAFLRSLCAGAERVLEVGCGTGVNLVGIADRIRSGVGVDFAPRMIARARSLVPRGDRSRLRFVAGAAADLDAVPEADGLFDLILLAGLLEHVPARGTVLAACHDRLGPAGRLVIVMPHPANPAFLWRRAVHGRDSRIFASDLHFTPRGLKRLARAHGLEPVRTRPLPCLPVFDDEPPPPAWARRAMHALGRIPTPATRGAYALVLRRRG